MLVSIGTQPVVMVPEAKHLQNVQWQRNGAIPQLITASFCGHRCEQQKRSPSISVSADSICTGNASGAVGWRAPTTTRSCSGGGGMQFDDWFFSSYSSYYISTPFIYNDWQSNTHWELCKKPPFSISLAFKLSDETFAGTFSFRCYLIFISHCFRLWPIASHRRLHTFTTIMESHFIWYV